MWRLAFASISAVSFKDEVGRKYTWKGLGPGLQLEVSRVIPL